MKNELDELTAIFTQPSDSNDAELDQYLTVKVENAGAGHYFVIETKRWAVDNAAELTNLIEKIQAIINQFNTTSK
jgi:adenosine/AMP kinase